MLEVRLRTGGEQLVSVDHAVSAVGSAEYIRWYDVLPAGEHNTITALDLALPAFLDAVPNFKALLSNCGADRLEGKLAVATAALRGVPADIDLALWDDTPEHRALLKRLFQACTGGRNDGFPEFGPARATKLLHKKRPRLLPIIDSWQLEAWGKRPEPWSTDDMVDVVFEIRDRVAGRHSVFDEVRTAASATQPLAANLSDVRIYDIVFWELSRPS